MRLRSAFNALGGVAVLAATSVVLFLPASAVGSASILVTNTNDSGAGSLRQAIIDANTSPGSAIVFQIPLTDANFNGSWFTIGVFSQLPVLSAGSTTIDGASQTSFSGDTNPLGPEIFLQARSQVFPENGAVVARSDSNVIDGLAIGGFPVGVVIGSGDGNVVRGDYLGTDPTGTVRGGSNNNMGVGFGIRLPDGSFGGDSTNTTIGGTTPAARNVISGNGAWGIDLLHTGSTSGVLIEGNYIGTNAMGDAALGTQQEGIRVGSISGVTIGGVTTGAGNVISGNGGNGVDIDGAYGAAVEGNYIGTDVSGTSALGNANAGIAVNHSAHTSIGGTSIGARNVISANGFVGIVVGPGAVESSILGNYIGTDVTGEAALPNLHEGVHVLGGATSTVIGGTASGAGNVIAGGDSDGVAVQGTGTIVQGNRIGTDASGMHPIGNAVGVFAGGTSTLIGGTPAGAGNLISGNSRSGVVIGAGAGTIVQGNSIGTNAAGTALPNAFDGIRVLTTGSRIDANVIAYNGYAGVDVLNGTSNAISQNSIFLNGELGIDLGGDGVTLNDSGDADTGPNNFQNFPVITSALLSGGQLVVKGTIDTPSPETVTLEFFGNPVPVPGGDPSGYGEGATFLGTATTAANGSFTLILPPVAPGTLISATATDAAGNTSEFAKDAAALLASADQCKNGGWQSFGVFKNQGDCVSFVATHGGNPADG